MTRMDPISSGSADIRPLKQYCHSSRRAGHVGVVELRDELADDQEHEDQPRQAGECPRHAPDNVGARDRPGADPEADSAARKTSVMRKIRLSMNGDVPIMSPVSGSRRPTRSGS